MVFFIRSKLVNKIIESFEDPYYNPLDYAKFIPKWIELPKTGKALPLMFGIDGSIQIIEKSIPPYTKVAYVKTALIKINLKSIYDKEKKLSHPLYYRDFLKKNSVYHTTVFPLRHLRIPKKNTFDTIRKIIFDSLKDSKLNHIPMKIFKWLIYEKWSNKKKKLPLFQCPVCRERVVTFAYNNEIGNCPKCGAEIYLTDIMGFHFDMTPDSAKDSVAKEYMKLHETLLLFSGIRFFWENNKKLLSKCLFVKDGPLYFRSPYTNLIKPIRHFLEFAKNQGVPIYIIGQEKSGNFYDHLNLIGKNAPSNSYFIPNDQYITEVIHGQHYSKFPYGFHTNYGAKTFLNLNNSNFLMINIPTGMYISNPSQHNLIGADKIFSTLPKILSPKYEGALIPIELAHKIASISDYPSAHILKLFTESMGSF